VYVRGYVCAIIGFGRARVTIVIKSYEAGAGWRRTPSLLPVAAPVISRIYASGAPRGRPGFSWIKRDTVARKVKAHHVLREGPETSRLTRDED